MKKIYAVLMKVLHIILGLLVAMSLCILLYALFGPGKKEQYSDSSMDKVVESNGEISEDIDYFAEVKQEDVIIEELPEGELPEEELPEEELPKEELSGEEAEESANLIDEDRARKAVSERLRATDTVEFQGMQDVDGKTYYVFTMVGGEGVFYVDRLDGEVYYSDSETGELKILEPMAEDYTPVDTTGYILGDQLRVDGNCIRLKDFYHGMSFRDAMNLVLTRAGINEDIMSYDEVIYNTTSYNSTDGTHGIYDNIEISSRMGNYYFAGLPVKLHLRFDRPVGGDIEMTKEERMFALVEEIRLKVINDSETIAMQTEGEALMHEVKLVLGEPIKVEGYEQFGINKYVWYVGDDSLMLLYRTYDMGEGYEPQERMILDYITVIHKEKE